MRGTEQVERDPDQLLPEVAGLGRTDPPRDGQGARLRAAREAQRRSLADVAQAAALTKGYLSKVERGVATPSVASLLRICRALGVTVGSLLADGRTDDHQPVRAGAYPPIGFGGEGIVEHLLTPPLERRLQVIHSVIEPGGGSGDERYSLPVEVEFVLVLRGQLALDVGDEVHVLDAGDALTFPPDAPHAFRNPRARGDTEVLWALAPALPSDDPSVPPPIHG